MALIYPSEWKFEGSGIPEDASNANVFPTTEELIKRIGDIYECFSFVTGPFNFGSIVDKNL